MKIEIPLFKIVQEPLLPIMGSWIDAAPFVIFFVILAAAAFLLVRGWRVQLLRRLLQVLSAFFFIIFLHRCLCVVRGWVFGVKALGTNDVFAFGNLCMFVLLAAVTLTMGRVFCGWACPLGLFMELVGSVARLRARLSRKAELVAGYLVLVGTAVIVFWLAHLVRPGTQFVTENVIAIWSMALLLLLLLVLPFGRRDGAFKKIRFVSLALWLFLSIMSVFVTSPWCVLLGDEVDYSSVVALVSIILGSAVVSMAWCRYLCPMGAALGWMARSAPVRLGSLHKCSACGLCAEVCPMGALDKGTVDGSSCIYCGRCVERCGFAWQRDGQTVEQPTVPQTGAPMTTLQEGRS